VSAVKYELGFYIPEDDILHSHRRENPNCYIVLSTSSRSVLGLTDSYRIRAVGSSPGSKAAGT
jgi:hypothetical protein